MLRCLIQLLKEIGRGKLEKLPLMFSLTKQNKFCMNLKNICRFSTKVLAYPAHAGLSEPELHAQTKRQFDLPHWLLPPWGVELQISARYLAFPSFGMWGSQSYCSVLISNNSIIANIERMRFPRQLSQKWKQIVSNSLSFRIWFS